MEEIASSASEIAQTSNEDPKVSPAQKATRSLFVPSLDISVSYSCKWNYFLATWTTYNEVCPAYSNFLASKNLYDIRSIGDRVQGSDGVLVGQICPSCRDFSFLKRISRSGV
ncbi:hypothetical protein P8452_02770 [Trifolium repens]|nr:hypothetical protein P8452_02770 [Trifolium repens]